MRKSILTICVVLTALCVGALTPFGELEGKATRAFSHNEWASAAALLDLMLEQRPDSAALYGQAIVANGMRADSAEQMRLLQQAIDHHIAFDSVFSQVRRWSFSKGSFAVYRDFLLHARSAYPWMKRTVDAGLLRFYLFRKNGMRTVALATEMLDGAPDNVPFLLALAEGHMLSGCFSEGVAVYKRILEIEPDNYQALLELGNWYALYPQDGESGRVYLERANRLHPTPYVSRLLK